MSAVVTPVSNAPFYRAVRDEVEVFRAAARRGLPVLLKGPTGLREDTLRGGDGARSSAGS